MLEGSAGVYAVVGPGRLCSCPEALPAARTEEGQCGCMNGISLEPVCSI